MTYVVILANTHPEAARHAKKHQLPTGRWRYATRAATIRGLRVGEIHILSGFARRLDKHAIMAELRYTKGERVGFDENDERIGGEEAAAPEPREDAAPAEEALEQVEVSVKRRRKPPAQPAPAEVRAPVSGFF